MLQRKNKISQTLAANKKHIDSSLFLFFINVFNFIFPLLLSPIIISRCGVEGFGVVTLFQSIMLFVASITDYGFNINATREVTINQNNKEFINRYFFTISYAKSFLLSIALILAFIIFLFFPKASEYSLVYISSLAILIGRAYNPLWILRAIHKMKFIFYFYVFFKISSILIIYSLLNDVTDLYLVNLSIGLSDLLTCFFSTLFLFSNLKWKHFLPTINLVKIEIYSGLAVFIQTISIQANAYLNPMIFSFFVDAYSLGIYCIVEKIILVIKYCGSFVLNSVFPKACELNVQNRLKYNQFMKSLLLFLVISMIIAGLLLTFFSDFIVLYFIKENIEFCSNFLIYNAWIPLIVALNSAPFLNFMVYGKQKPVTYIYVAAVFINIILNIILSKFFGIYGISTGIYITEVFITLSLWIVLIKKYPNLKF
jgi:O-antigen/teichoic acid export membrane protein